MTIIGSTIGRIRIEALLGRGGMGEVYVGYDETLHRQVALKSIRASHRLSEDVKARFVREARILSQLDHPNICKIYDFIADGDRDFLVLELVQGRDLTEAIREGVGPSEKLNIARKISDALVAAHSEGVVHRDLKPENVMLTESGEVKVLDFGLAAPERVVAEPNVPLEAPSSVEETLEEPTDEAAADPDQTLVAPVDDRTLMLADTDEATSASEDVNTVLGTVMGTPTYMSPEQARGEQVTTASDMYSFGLLLQALYTGKSPHPSDSSREEVLHRARTGDTIRVVGLDSDLTRLIEGLKVLAPAARPTAVETADRLRWIANRPRRRALWTAAAAVMAILVAGGIKYTFDLRHERAIAVEARNEADLRRGQAEELIGFMLGDLREKLEPVGRLEILDDVGEQAMEYFAAIPESELSDEELLSRSKALYQIGEVRMTQGDLPAAEQPFRQSLALAEELLEREPMSGERLFAVGQGEFWVGYVHWWQGDTKATLTHWQRYLALSERLVDLNPENLDWQQELAYAHTNLGAVYEAEGQLDRALRAIGVSNEIKRRLVAADPENPQRRRSLAGGLSWLTTVLISSNRISEALEASRAEQEIRLQLAREDPRNTDSRHLLSISHGRVADLLLMTGEVQGALEQRREAQGIMQALVSHDSSNRDWYRELAVSHLDSGDSLLVAGESGPALAEIGTALGLLAELVEADPSNEDWRRELGIAHQKKASVLLATGRTATAVRSAQESLEVLGTLEPGNSREYQVSRAYLVLGGAHARSGRMREARAAWGQALELLADAEKGGSSPQMLDVRVRALLYLGRLEEAEPIVSLLIESGYARPDFVALCREHGLQV